eukprot:Rmarinus@m.8695
MNVPPEFITVTAMLYAQISLEASHVRALPLGTTALVLLVPVSHVLTMRRQKPAVQQAQIVNVSRVIVVMVIPLALHMVSTGLQLNSYQRIIHLPCFSRPSLMMRLKFLVASYFCQLLRWAVLTVCTPSRFPQVCPFHPLRSYLLHHPLNAMLTLMSSFKSFVRIPVLTRRTWYPQVRAIVSF